MFEIGGWELLVVGVIALIVVGPKDLPRLVRNVGRWVGKARTLARDFQSGMEKAAREADLEDEAKALRDVERGVREGASGLTRDLRSIGSTGPAPTAGVQAPRAPSPAPAPSVVRSTAETADDALLRGFQRGVRGDE